MERGLKNVSHAFMLIASIGNNPAETIAFISPLAFHCMTFFCMTIRKENRNKNNCNELPPGSRSESFGRRQKPKPELLSADFPGKEKETLFFTNLTHFMIFSFAENLLLYASAANKLFYETAPDVYVREKEKERKRKTKKRERERTADTILGSNDGPMSPGNIHNNNSSNNSSSSGDICNLACCYSHIIFTSHIFF